MSNEFKRVPTCGENDVDLRVATEPRRAADRLTASVQFHELAQGYRAATPDGAQAAYEKLCAYLEGRECASTPSVDRNTVLAEVADQVAQFDKRATPKGIAVAIRCMKKATPQPVDAAQGVPEQRFHWSKAGMVLDVDGYYKHATPSPAAQPAAQAVPELHAAIMNLPCKPGRAIAMNGASKQAYQEGHRDARHAAAELALAGAPVAQPTDTTKGA